MKAAILNITNKPLEIDDIEFIGDLKYGQILVKLFYTSICGSQIGEIDGIKGKDKFLPHLLGHEGSGKVVDIGPGVSKIKKNDHVVLHWRKNSGVEGENAKYLWLKKNKIINSGKITTFSEYSVVSENRLTPISKKFNLKHAALFGCAITTAFGVIKNEAKSSIGDSILIIGVGGVGLNCVIAAKLVSNYPIIVMDISNKKLKLAEDLGADITINCDKKSNQILYNKICKYYNIDYCIETTGLEKNIELAYRSVNQEGKVVLVGVPNVKRKIRLNTLDLHFGKNLIGTVGGGTIPEIDINKYMNVIKNKKINLDKLIYKTYPLVKINKAIEDIRKKSIVGKTIIKL